MPDLQDELSRLEARLDPARAGVIDELATVRKELPRRPEPRAPVRLANLRIASPCKERWADMTGDDRVRVCNGCERPVFNLSEMTFDEAEAVLATRGVTPCVRFFRRADGTIMTSDCAPGARRRIRIAAVAAGALLAGASPAQADPPPDQPPVALQDATGGAIEGTVRDADTGEALFGVTVVITSPTGQTATAITDENGSYRVTALPPADGYLVAFYHDDSSVERRDVAVVLDRTTSLSMEVKSRTIDVGTITMGVPPLRSTYDDTIDEMGVIIMEPEHRPTIEWSTWARLGVGTESQAPAGITRSITPPQRDAERHATIEAALGAEVTLPLALHGDLRVGAWTEVRTSSGPVLGGEVRLQALPHRLDLFRRGGEGILAIRAGGNAHVVTGAIAYGYLAPWTRWGPWDGATRYMIGVRVVASATRSVDDPRDWTATAGIELEPVGAARYLLMRGGRLR
jgi:hypothetical protein